MSIEDTFGSLFKPEVKSSGRKLVSLEKISLSTQSDTLIQAIIKVAPPFRVKLSTEEISSPTFSVECSCPAARKNRFCKHVWATLLYVEENYPDFLSEKRDIENLNTSAEPKIDKQSAFKESAKLRASEHRKEQYQKQKARVKEKKREQKGTHQSNSLQSYSPEIEAALAYFSQNGFPMPSGPTKEIIVEAKRKLSRLFHPDKGGTHEESVELNKNCEVLLHFIQE